MTVQGARDRYDRSGSGAHLLSVAGRLLSGKVGENSSVYQQRVVEADRGQRRAVLHPSGKN